MLLPSACACANITSYENEFKKIQEYGKKCVAQNTLFATGMKEMAEGTVTTYKKVK